MAYRRPHPCDFIRRNRRTDARTVDDDARLSLAASNRFRHTRSGIGIVHWIGRQRAKIVHGDPFSAQRGNDRSFQRQTGVVAANGNASNVGNGCESFVRPIERILGDDCHPARLQRVSRKRCHMPALTQGHCFAQFEQARVSFGDDLEPFHVIFRATVTTLFTAEQIQQRINELATQINAEYPDGEPLHFVAVLKGAFIFLSDLARAMSPRPVTLDFIAVSSYGAATKSSGEVRLLKDLDIPLQGRDVIIVEDIVDTGLTLHYLQDVLRARDPKSLRTACLLSKPSRRKVDVVVEYIGFEIEDKFVVGYGLDNAGQFRHLPYIGVQE